MPKGKDPELAAGASGSAGQSPDLTVVYLARHGQTPLNESGVLRASDIPVRTSARRQARAPLGFGHLLRTLAPPAAPVS